MLVYAVLVLMRCAPDSECESTASASTVYAHDCRSCKSSSPTAITPLPSWLGSLRLDDPAAICTCTCSLIATPMSSAANARRSSSSSSSHLRIRDDVLVVDSSCCTQRRVCMRVLSVFFLLPLDQGERARVREHVYCVCVCVCVCVYTFIPSYIFTYIHTY